MQKIQILGALLFAPGIIRAHDDVLHPATTWYQEPLIIAAIFLAVLAVGVLGYGLMTKKKSLITIASIAFMAVTLTGFVWLSFGGDTSQAQLVVADFGAGQAVTLYKSPNCGCCTGHAKALEAAGFVVTIEETENLDAVKQANNIPADGASCHTSIIGDYVVEGHVPLAAIEKLLSENLNIDGIGLAGMPIGTPGMPGIKTAPYEIYQLADEGEMSPYLTI